MTILGPFVETQPRRLKLIFSPDPAKPASLRLEMNSLGLFENPPSRRCVLIFTPDPVQLASLRLEMYSLGLFENRPSCGFVLIFTPGPEESNTKVIHEPLKMTILGPCVEKPPRSLKLIFTSNPSKPATLRLEMISLGFLRIHSRSKRI